MPETTQRESNGTVNDSKLPKDEKEKKTMQVEEGSIKPKGSSKKAGPCSLI